MVNLRRSAGVGLWLAVCVLAKISFRLTTYARLTQSHAYLQSIAFSSPSDLWEKRTSFTFIIFRNCFLPFPVPLWSKFNDLLLENLQVVGGQLQNPPVVPGRILTSENVSFGVCASRPGGRSMCTRVETSCSFVISNSSSSNEQIFEYFGILAIDRKVVANPIFKIPIGQEVQYNIP